MFLLIVLARSPRGGAGVWVRGGGGGGGRGGGGVFEQHIQ